MVGQLPLSFFPYPRQDPPCGDEDKPIGSLKLTEPLCPGQSRLFLCDTVTVGSGGGDGTDVTGFVSSFVSSDFGFACSVFANPFGIIFPGLYRSHHFGIRHFDLEPLASSASCTSGRCTYLAMPWVEGQSIRTTGVHTTRVAVLTVTMTTRPSVSESGGI